MDVEQLNKAIGLLRSFFERKGIAKCDYPHDELLLGFSYGLEHCHSMLDKMEGFISENRLDKVCRWLGFIQGCLWMSGIYTLDSLKDMNRKNKSSS